MASDAAFADWLKQARKNAGLSQDELASAMAERGHDFHQQTVYKIESGNRRVSIGEAISLADSVGAPLSLFMESDPVSLPARRAEIELKTKRLLESLVALEKQVRDGRNALQELRELASTFDDAAGDDLQDWWGSTSTAKEALDPLFDFHDLDGLQWSWEQFQYSRPGHRLMKRLKVIPASDLPIEGYDKIYDEDDE